MKKIAKVINNNQPGWTNIIETAPHITLDVGTELYISDTPRTIGIELIEAERHEQIEKHGFDARHDDEPFNDSGELVQAALYLLDPLYHQWPKSWSKKMEGKFAKKLHGVETLKVAGALIAAEIDRLQRLSAK